MGFAEIQAAFQATSPAPIQPTAPQLAPSPFGPGGGGATSAAFAFQPPQPAPAPAVQLAHASAAVQQAFTFTPPAGAPTAPNGTAFPPINPPGERGVLAAPTPAPAPVQTSTFQAVAQASAPASEPAAPAEPKAKRTRKPRAPGVVAVESTLVPDLAKKAELADLPPDGSTVEDIVEELFARGVVRVHLEFTKDGLR